MRYLTTKSKKLIRQAIDFLSLNRRPITLRIEGDEDLYDSTIVKADHGNLPSKLEAPERLIVNWLFPEKGNHLIQSADRIQVRFSLGKSQCEFISRYVARSVESPYFGHILRYPQSLAVSDRRRQDRYEKDSRSAPLFVSARFQKRTSRSRSKSYDLNIFDVSESGVGLLVDREFHDFLEGISVGDRLTEVELCASWAIIKVNGTVRHKSKISGGRYRGCHVVGIELDEKLDQYT